MRILIESDDVAAGQTAGRAAADALRRILTDQPTARVVFASAPSQAGMIATLVSSNVDLAAIEALHMDEYCGIEPGHSAAFGQWLEDRLGSAVTLHRLDPQADPDPEVARYAALVQQAPIDLALVGIGVNGHIAFNEPHDLVPAGVLVRRVDLTRESRQQQVDDGCFASLNDVPHTAVTLTTEALMSAKQIICTVLGPRKAPAVRAALRGDVGAACPASVLQQHHDVLVVLDQAAASLLYEDDL